MKKLDELIEETQRVRDEVMMDPSKGSQMYWVARLSALKEAKLIWDEHVKNEFDKCATSVKYFTENYATIKKKEPIEEVFSREMRVIVLEGQRYLVSYEYVAMGELCWNGIENTEYSEDTYCKSEIHACDMQSWNAAYNYGWKVMAQIQGYRENSGDMEARGVYVGDDPNNFFLLRDEHFDSIANNGGRCRVVTDGKKGIKTLYDKNNFSPYIGILFER